MKKRRLSAKPSRNPNHARLERLVTAILFGATSSAMAQSTWSGGTSTDWNDGTNWSAGVPNANTAIINTVPANIATVSATPATNPARLDVGQAAGAVTGQLDITGGLLTVLTAGVNQTAVFIGGGNAAATGTLNVTGSGSLLARNTTATTNHQGRIHIGGDDAGNEGGTGTINVNTTGSVFAWDDILVGTLPTNSTTINNVSGTVNLDAGSIQGGQTAPGPGGGVIDTNAWSNFGFNNIAAANGTPTVGQVVGTLNQTGGTFSQYGRIYFGRGRNATGNLNLSGGTLQTLQGTTPGTADNWQMFLGQAGGIANVSITGSALVSSASHIKFGDTGNATVTQNGAGSRVITGAGAAPALAGELWIANGTNPVTAAASTVVYTLDAGRIEADSWIAVGRANGNGTLNVNGGSIIKTGADATMLSIGTLGTGTTGTVNQTAGLVDIQTGHVFIAEQAAAGQTATANYNISGTGILQTTGTGTNAALGGTTAASVVLGAVNVGNVIANLDLNGGQVRTNRIIGGANVGATTQKNVDFNGTEIVALSNQGGFLGGDTLATGGFTSAEVESGGMWINTNGFNVGTNQDFTDGGSAGGLRKTGLGILTIDTLSSSSFTGASSLEAGTLELNGSLGNTPTALWSGTTLAGTGTHGGVVTSTGATISPGITGGAGVGALNFAANVSLDSASFLTLTINDEAPGSLDQVLMGGGTFAAGSATLSVDFNDTTFTVANSAGDLALATQYAIVTGTTSGMFGNATTMSAGDVALLGLSGTQYEATLDGQRFWIKAGSFTLVPLAPVLVPEPGTTGLLGGLALLGLTRRRRK